MPRTFSGGSIGKPKLITFSGWNATPGFKGFGRGLEPFGDEPPQLSKRRGWRLVEGESKRVVRRRRPNPNLGPAAGRIRERLNVSQTMLGWRLECSQQYVSKFERGLVPMTATCVERVADALGVSAREIYREAREISRYNQMVVQPESGE
jgi:hypothetical protein